MNDDEPEAKRVKIDKKGKRGQSPMNTRRLHSVFASNQAIHNLTNSILESKQSSMERGDSLMKNVDNGNNSDGNIQVTTSQATNTTIACPHPRHLCPLHSFRDSGKHHIYCENCHCYVCNLKASECTNWNEDHCHAHDGDEKWKKRSHNSNEVVVFDITSDNENVEEDEEIKIADSTQKNDTICSIVQSNVSLQKNEMLQNQNSSNSDLIERSQPSKDQNYHPENSRINLYQDDSEEENGESEKKPFRPDKARITEVLAHNLSSLDLQSNTLDNDPHSMRMVGDISQLNLHKSFFVEGVRIGWPFPKIMPPQRQMAFHLVKAFKTSSHVVLESPTGTGKSAAILCAALAWQRFNYMTNGVMTKIIYCSRTHSQVAQMVSSLRKTSYRPRMSILGSRDRMCIHEDLQTKYDENGNKKKINFTSECQMRVKNTESFRKRHIFSETSHYDDDQPPESWPGDFDDYGVEEDENIVNVEEPEEDSQPRKNEKTCPHYRQLTARRTAENVHSTFIPNKKQISCCNLGGEKTKFGIHDIEDLVAFGKQPEVDRGIAIYRDEKAETTSFGFSLEQKKLADSQRSEISINKIAENGAADREKSLRKGDMLISCNKKEVNRRILRDVTNEIRNSQDPLLLDVYRGKSTFEKDEYSPNASCPYYLSRALAAKADLVFAPYNYVLDPRIRDAIDIDLSDAIVILDEAHNVEDTLRQLGSGTFGEIDLCKIVAMLSSYASMMKCEENAINHNTWSNSNTDDEGTVYIPDVAHDLLVLMERIVIFLEESREEFERKPGPNGRVQAIAEYERFKTPDTKQFDVFFFGPTGSGVYRQPIGCKMFFDKIGFTETDAETIMKNSALFEQYMTSRSKDTSTRRLLVDKLVSFVSGFVSAYKYPEHYYIASTVSPNGNFDYAAGLGEKIEFTRRGGRFKKKPQAKPLYPPTSGSLIPCEHAVCRVKNNGKTYHGKCCDGSIPKWEGHFVLNLLCPSILMEKLASMSRSVVLASGTLAPITSLCAELNLLSKSSYRQSDQSDENTNRLQMAPRPLEANHVIDLRKQLLVCAVGHLMDGSPLTVKMSNYSRPDFLEKLGDAIATIVEGIPHGGVLVFFPSFSLLRKCANQWQENTIWDRLIRSKGNVVVEPSSSQSEFEEARDMFNHTITQNGKCILLAVFRGKMSEGISFNDEYARCVICVGIPLPSFYDKAIAAKIKYNNEQRLLRGRNLLPGNQWYQQQAYRAIAQAIGRCIRHAADYGTIILLDNRHCENQGSRINSSGLCEAHEKLPKWMRHSVRTLRIGMRSSTGRNEILGGWEGLSKEMKRFFCEAKVHVASVLRQQKEDLKRVQQRDENSKELTFNRKTGKWSRSVIDAKQKLSSNFHASMTDSKVNGIKKISENVNKNSIPLTQVQNKIVPMQLELFLNDNASTNVNATPKRGLNEEEKLISNSLNSSPANTSISCGVGSSLLVGTENLTNFNPTNKDIISSTSSASSRIVSPVELKMSPAKRSQSFRNTEDHHLCTICIEREKNILLLPCKHLCLCRKCFKDNNLYECPMCRTPIESHLDVFL